MALRFYRSRPQGIFHLQEAQGSEPASVSLCEGTTSVLPDASQAKAKPKTPKAKLLSLCDLQHATGRGFWPRTLHPNPDFLLILLFSRRVPQPARAEQEPLKAYARAALVPGLTPTAVRVVRKRLRVASWAASRTTWIKLLELDVTAAAVNPRGHMNAGVAQGNITL